MRVERELFCGQIALRRASHWVELHGSQVSWRVKLCRPANCSVITLATIITGKRSAELVLHNGG